MFWGFLYFGHLIPVEETLKVQIASLLSDSSFWELSFISVDNDSIIAIILDNILKDTYALIPKLK